MGSGKFCEVCGQETRYLSKRIIEGVLMKVCDNCKDLGEEPPEQRKIRIQSQQKRALGYAPKNISRTNNSRKYSSNHSSTIITSHRRPPRHKKEPKLTDYRVKDDAIDTLKKLRKDLNLTPQDIAQQLQIKENYYKRIERKHTALPLELARKIEKKYHVSLLELEDYEDEDDYSRYLKKNKEEGEAMIYFRKRGQKPEYD